ncbi:N-acetyltransferase family protein [Salinarimonas sp.]|uniref:GNAT family N-acetyltransferase n=1 Tax=Salinarimonas sp. TaxID=2766526 RepID=UPI00391A8216
MTVSLRPMLPADGPLLADIYREAILGIGIEDYDEAQCEAWASLADDEAAFAARLSGMLTLVALRDGEVAGFAALEKNATIAMLYVSPDHAGEGVATALVDALEKLAAARGTEIIEASASDTALPLFQKRGYEPRQRSTTTIAGQWLANTHLTKRLAPAQAQRPS